MSASSSSHRARTWITSLATANVLASPKAMSFRRKSPPSSASQVPVVVAAVSTLEPPKREKISIQMLTTLAQLVEFLDEHHRHEDGLYRREGQPLECSDLMESCLDHDLPNLELYSPHSMTVVIKQILADKCAPLIPYHISSQLLEQDFAIGDVDQNEQNHFHTFFFAKFKQIRAVSREFLQIFLLHLNHVSTSIACHTDAKSLAQHIGMVLVRPSEDKKLLQSQDMTRRRQRIAEYLITHAKSLPYETPTELEIKTIPDKIMSPCSTPRDEDAVLTADNHSNVSAPLYFVQLMWDNSVQSFSSQQLKEMFASFGPIIDLGVNNQSNEAIIAYSTAEAATAAANAEIPHLQMTLRYQKRSAPDEVSSLTLADSNQPCPPDPLNLDSLTKMAPMIVPQIRHVPPENQSNEQSSQPMPSTPEKFLLTLERPPSMVFTQKIQETRRRGSIIIEDIESAPSSSSSTHSALLRNQTTKTSEHQNTDAIKCQLEKDEQTDETPYEEMDERKPEKSVSENDIEQFMPSQRGSKVMDDKSLTLPANEVEDVLIPIYTEKNPKSQPFGAMKVPRKEGDISHHQLTIAVRSRGTVDSTASPKQSTQDPSLKATLVSPEKLARRSSFFKDIKQALKRTKTPIATKSKKLVTSSSHSVVGAVGKAISQEESRLEDVKPAYRDEGSQTFPGEFYSACSDKATNTTESLSTPTNVDKNDSADISAYHAAHGKLRDMQTILQTSIPALSAMKTSSELERALLQLHTQLFEMVKGALAAWSPESISAGEPAASEHLSVNEDFLKFLEIQSKTQVKILEVEVRAGQDLLRLHKTQHEQEIQELEKEVATLRLARSEVERLCAELRSSLRNCRSELACHIANSTKIQRYEEVLCNDTNREKTAAEERFVLCENKLRAKEIELATLQSSFENMKQVAAQAQIRVDKYRQQTLDSDASDRDNNQKEHEPQLRHIPRQHVHADQQLPRTTKFFQEQERQARARAMQGDSSQSTSISNVEALEQMKVNLHREIQDQIATTKAALRELEISNMSGATFEEEREVLLQLQQQLAAKNSEMEDAMDESRRKLKRLLHSSKYTGTSQGVRFTLSSTPEETSSTPFTPNQHELFFKELLERVGYNEHSTETLNSKAKSMHPTEFDTRQITLRDITGGINSHKRPREAQSRLYQQWTADRQRKLSQLSALRNPQRVRQAQQSMERFQQTLASFHAAREQQ